MSVNWIKRKAEESDTNLKIWDRNSLFIYHTYAPSPTVLKSSQEIIQAIQYMKGFRDVYWLKTEETKNGWVLIGMTDRAAYYVDSKEGAVFCRLTNKQTIKKPGMNN